MDKWKEILKQSATLLSKGQQLTTFANIGTSDAEDLKSYMEEREGYINDVSKFLADFPAALEKEFDEMNNALKDIRKNLVEFKQPKKELTKKDVYKAMGKALLYSLFGLEAFHSEESRKELRDIVAPGIFATDKSERNVFVGKDAIDTPLDPGGTNAGYTVNPIYERELIKYAAEYSDMMPFVRRLPMVAPQHSFPFLSARDFVMTRSAATSSGTTWSASSKLANSTDGPTFGARVTITATTLAAYIPWIDEFKDDLQLNESLDQLMSECFQEAYATDFDENVLTNNSDDIGVQYDGLLYTDGVQEKVVDASSLNTVAPDMLRTALLKIARTERDGGYWILNETVLDRLTKVRNSVGDYMFWTPPSGDMPGRIAGRPYIEAHVMPDADEINPGDTFMLYANPDNLWVGERAGLEIRKFDATQYQLEYGENFTRWRIRNGFKVVKPLSALKVKLKA
jgi:HK97 family phage major capsid protein